MTPRSRKPVIIGALRDMQTDGYHNKFIGFQMNDDVAEEEDDDDPDFIDGEISDRLNASFHRSKSESDLLLQSSAVTQEESNGYNSNPVTKSTSDETLSTPFR